MEQEWRYEEKAIPRRRGPTATMQVRAKMQELEMQVRTLGGDRCMRGSTGSVAPPTTTPGKRSTETSPGSSAPQQDLKVQSICIINTTNHKTFFITTENVHTHHKSPIKVKPHKRKAYTGTVVMSQKAMYMMMSPEGNEETSG